MKTWFTYKRSAWSRRATAITCAGFLAVGAAAFGSLVFNGQLFAASNPPAPTIQSGPANPTNQTSAHFLFTDSQSGVTLWCSLDSPTFTLCSSPQDYTGLAAGDHSFKVQARSGTQTSANTEYKWKIDVTPPPAPQITAQPTDPTTSTAASFTFKDSEGGVTFLCSLDGAAYAACTSPKAYSGLGVGLHTFGVEAQDAAGNVSAPTTDSWTIQGVAPPAPTITAQPSDPTASTSATFSFTDANPSATFLCKLDAGAYAACTSPKTYAGALAEGTHTFSVEAVANAQTSAATSFTWRVDTTAPTISVSFPSDGGVYNAAAWNAGCAGGAGICGSATDPSGVAGGAVSILRAATGKYWDGTGFNSSSEIFNAATPTSQSGTTFSGGYPLALPPDGSYTVHVRAQDNLGNTTPAGSQVVINFTVDTTPPSAPAITSNPASVTPSSTASFSFTGEAGVDLPLQARRRLVRRVLEPADVLRPGGGFAHVQRGGEGHRRKRRRGDVVHVDGRRAGSDDHVEPGQPDERPDGELLVHRQRRRGELPLQARQRGATRRARARRATAAWPPGATPSASRRKTERS